MSKVANLKRFFDEGGIKKIGAETGVHVLTRPSIARIFQRLLGAPLYEKAVTALRVGYWPNFENPTTFVENIQHRKLYTDNEFYSTLADKWAVREYVQERVGEDILNDVYVVADEPSNIDFESLPNEFVLKATHASGFVEIVDEKENRDLDALRSLCEQWINEEFGGLKNEYWYEHINPQIMVSKRLESLEGEVPSDYKFYVFHGEVKYVHVDFDRFEGHKRRMYQPDWTPTEIKFGWPKGEQQGRPDNLDAMIEIAEDLGEGIDFVRVDLFDTKEEGIVFGEMTLAPEGGRWGFKPRSADYEFGQYW